MPYHIGKSSECPNSKPHAVIKDSDGKVMGCHATEDDAHQQIKALYANEAAGASTMIEKRTFPAQELRAVGGNKLVGHAAVFNKKSDEIFGFREIVLPGAFKETIEKDDIRALWNHDPAQILGRNRAGTLKLEEDSLGLRTEIDLPDTQLGHDIYASVKRGDVSQMSFGFTILPDGDKWRRESGELVRELVKVGLFDVSPVTFPAYPATDISARGFYEARMKLALLPEDEEKAKAEYAARAQARRELIDRLTPPPDPKSLAEILKRCRING